VREKKGTSWRSKKALPEKGSQKMSALRKPQNKVKGGQNTAVLGRKKNNHSLRITLTEIGRKGGSKE